MARSSPHIIPVAVRGVMYDVKKGVNPCHACLPARNNIATVRGRLSSISIPAPPLTILQRFQLQNRCVAPYFVPQPRRRLLRYTLVLQMPFFRQHSLQIDQPDNQ